MSAPICHVPGTKPPINTPTNTMPNVPVVHRTGNVDNDLDALIRAINALRLMIMRLTGQDQSGDPSAPRSAPRIPQEQKRVQWVEQRRSKKKVKIYQNNDKTSENWVEVEQITTLVMQDKNTGQTWEWKLGG